ncbi:MAG TPA: hypothetical protein VLA51_04185, partial [Paracoccaceae bacterium]|nr:hypothetical protein [Paracoccaceae bacterium]
IAQPDRIIPFADSSVIPHMAKAARIKVEDNPLSPVTLRRGFCLSWPAELTDEKLFIPAAERWKG